MHAIKANLFNQLNPIIENQLYLPNRHRGTQHPSIGQQLRLRPALVAVLKQSHSSLSQRLAQSPQKMRTSRSRNNRSIQNRVNLRK
jgi:hypothetical protein